jgi:hypothetical protein
MIYIHIKNGEFEINGKPLHKNQTLKNLMIIKETFPYNF